MYTFLLFGERLMHTKSYPKALHMYRMEYKDNTCRTIYACGMTHAYAMSKEYWPQDEIAKVFKLDDSWKN